MLFDELAALRAEEIAEAAFDMIFIILCELPAPETDGGLVGQCLYVSGSCLRVMTCLSHIQCDSTPARCMECVYSG